MDKGNYNLVQGKKYTLNGEEKIQWIRVGKFLNKSDKPSIKLDVYPIPNPDGEIWLNIYPEDENEGRKSNDIANQQFLQNEEVKKEDEKKSDEDGDEIPF